MQACDAVDFYIISGSCVHLDEDGTRQEWETEAADWEMKYPCPIPTGCSPPGLSCPRRRDRGEHVKGFALWTDK